MSIFVYTRTSHDAVRALGADEINFKRRALRDATLCIGWMKLASIFKSTALNLSKRIVKRKYRPDFLISTLLCF